MCSPLSFTAPGFFKPACLPTVLKAQSQAMATATGDAARQTAALTIVKEYQHFFGATGMRQDMWMLTSGALGSGHTDNLSAAERYNLLFFYEFTLLFFDAVYVLHAGERFGKMG